MNDYNKPVYTLLKNAIVAELGVAKLDTLKNFILINLKNYF